MIIGITGKAGAGKDTAADVLVERFNFVKVALADPLKRICKDVFDFSDEQLWGPSQMRNEEDKRYPRENAGVRMARNIAADLATDDTPVPPAVREWSQKDIREYLTPRYALQQLGTEWGRDCYDNIWVDYAMRTAKKLMTGAYIYHQKYGLQEFDIITPAIRKKFELGTGMVMAAGGVVIPDVRFKNEADAIRQAGGKIWRIIRPGAGLEGDAGKHASEVEQDGIEADLAIHNGLDIKTLIQMVHDAYGQMTRDTLPAPPGDDIEAIFRLEEDVDSELQLTPSFTQADGSVVLPNQPACLDRLSTLLEQRQKDVDAGKIRPYEQTQQDVAPFKRTR